MDNKVILLTGICLLLTLALIFMFFSQTDSDDELLIEDFANEVETNETNESEVKEKEEEVIKKVDVKGAVNRPGVYIAGDGDRVLDLIEKAGGFSKNANRNSVNLAQRVEDQMLLYVLSMDELAPNTAVPLVQGGGSGTTQQEGRININTASESDLQEITGIGPSKAEAIIQYRTEKGSFKDIEELKEISGIGEKTFEKLKDEVTI